MTSLAYPAEPPPVPLAPPPELEYDSRKALLDSINAWAKQRGYAFTTAKSTDRHGRWVVVYGCDRYGVNTPKVNDEDRQRNRTSRKCNCKFSILAKETHNKTWVVRYRPDREFLRHNHEPREQPPPSPPDTSGPDRAAECCKRAREHAEAARRSAAEALAAPAGSREAIHAHAATAKAAAKAASEAAEACEAAPATPAARNASIFASWAASQAQQSAMAAAFPIGLPTGPPPEAPADSSTAMDVTEGEPSFLVSNDASQLNMGNISNISNI